MGNIEKYYDMQDIGKFPTRLAPITLRCEITDLPNIMKIEDIYKKLSTFNMSVYSPFNYIIESKIDFYSELYDDKVNDKGTLKQKNRENNLKILIRIDF